ncbi:hypothetical protein EW145_g4557 [Phellinidium pouzarii]|uniref:Methyltransferase type 11 domain-containing protein n=1 Tax=Phellinidium pouzarii TaxID=167371 RepID=A0A4S4L3K4_9AGAM|nr:hypothetical protein EW145_g4557 [Phellinidium pouzarii]
MASPSPFSGKVHPISAAGFGPGKSELYDKVRPGYAPQVLSHIRKAVSKKEGLKIVEIGCGSGIFTRALLAHPEWSTSVAELKCIDPNEGMRAVFASTVKDSRVSLSEGTFDETDVPDGWADLIVSASAFHWCSELEGAINEFSRILKSDGTICFLWNSQDKKNTAWIRQIHELCDPHQKVAASGKDTFNNWRRIFDLPQYKANFSEPEETIVPSTETRTVESLTLHVFTRSGVAILPDEEKEKVREGIKVIVQRGDELVWVNKKEGILEVPFATPIVVIQRQALQ